MKRINVCLPDRLGKKMDQVTEATGLTVSEVARRAIALHFLTLPEPVLKRIEEMEERDHNKNRKVEVQTIGGETHYLEITPEQERNGISEAQGGQK